MKTLAILMLSMLTVHAAVTYDLSGVPAHLRTQPVINLGQQDVPSVYKHATATVTEKKDSSLLVTFKRTVTVKLAGGTTYARVDGKMKPIVGAARSEDREVTTVFNVINYPKWKEASIGDSASFPIIAGPPVAGVCTAYYLPPPTSSRTLR